MEKFSNEYKALLATAQAEVYQFEMTEEESLILSFSEFPAIAPFPYCYGFIQQADGNIRSCFRQWDGGYDLKRWKMGIYNLDRLRIITAEAILNGEELSNLEFIFHQLGQQELPQNIEKEGAITLDPSLWQLAFNWKGLKSSYQWKAANNDISFFIPLIEWIQEQHRDYNKR